MPKHKRRYPVLNALKGRIREKETSYRELAERLGIAANSLSDKLNGHYPFTIAEAEALADLLDIAPNDVVYFFMPAYSKTQHA